MEDITERKRAQEVLREKDSQFRNYVENAPVAIVVTRVGACLYANQALADMLGAKSSEALVGGRIYEGFAPHMQEESKERSRRRSLGLVAPRSSSLSYSAAMGHCSPPTCPSGPSSFKTGAQI